MRKLLMVFILAFISPLSLAGIRVLTCEPEWAALATTLAGANVDVYSATTAQQDPHTIQARPSLIAQARQADLLICSGAELEIGWLPLLLQKSANKKIQTNAAGYFMAADHVELSGKVRTADRSAGDVHLGGNPHIHTNPHNMLKVADALLPVLVQLLPGQSAELRQNHAVFTQKMQSALIQWQPLITALNGKKVVVHHDNWVYLNQWLGLNKVATLEPKPGVPPTTGHLAGLLMQLKNNPADIIIYTDYQDSKPAQWLSAKTGLPALQLPSSVSEWQQPDALIQWYGELLTLLNAAL
jgi:zinc/manganese transport system substrate-binding protein